MSLCVEWVRNVGGVAGCEEGLQGVCGLRVLALHSACPLSVLFGQFRGVVCVMVCSMHARMYVCMYVCTQTNHGVVRAECSCAVTPCLPLSHTVALYRWGC